MSPNKNGYRKSITTKKERARPAAQSGQNFNPFLFGMRVIDKHIGFSTKYGVSCEMMAIMGTIFLATVSAFLFDRLKVQRNLAGFLRRIFEDGWCRRARLLN